MNHLFPLTGGSAVNFHFDPHSFIDRINETYQFLLKNYVILDQYLNVIQLVASLKVN